MKNNYEKKLESLRKYLNNGLDYDEIKQIIKNAVDKIDYKNLKYFDYLDKLNMLSWGKPLSEEEKENINKDYWWNSYFVFGEDGLLKFMKEVLEKINSIDDKYERAEKLEEAKALFEDVTAYFDECVKYMKEKCENYKN